MVVESNLTMYGIAGKFFVACKKKKEEKTKCVEKNQNSQYKKNKLKPIRTKEYEQKNTQITQKNTRGTHLNTTVSNE